MEGMVVVVTYCILNIRMINSEWIKNALVMVQAVVHPTPVFRLDVQCVWAPNLR